MSEMQSTPTAESPPLKGQLLTLTSEIVSAHVSRNAVQTNALPDLIRAVYEALASVGMPAETANAEKPTPAVPIKRSVFPDYIVCLEDGKKLKMLRRHLGSAYGMTPEQYRERWGLPADYPMVAPNYATRRSELARAIGLGHKTGGEPPAALSSPATDVLAEENSVPVPNESPHVTVLPERKRGRRKAVA
ncbi:MucR family transcriptional regulator [Gluconacetobacter azotocaptans]|uniref:MucR family transcriptional regulator n=1 Tax=Gluconacetobacter azotocaptans TaxID=142834 RepID=UPI00195EBECE|nr:MucR family transcriptional regulator [Gluconacetobacter azotocaptans]MBM9400819.1 MucR family transcriptional regulator [Gluconacetobacter azotocaptans]